MNPIIPPVNISMSGEAVTNLQLALVQLGYEISPAEIRSKLFNVTTQEAVSRFQTEQRLTVNGGVDEATANALNRLLKDRGRRDDEPAESEQSFWVRGIVTQIGGKGLSGLEIKAYHHQLRKEIHLVDAKTDEKGNYKLQIQPNSQRQIPWPIDLQVKVLDKDKRIIAESEILHEVDSDRQLDFSIPVESHRGPSIYNRFKEATAPHLGDLRLEVLDETERAFLARKVQATENQMRSLITANRFAPKNPIPEPAFFAMLEAAPAEEVEGLYALKASFWEEGIKKAVDDNLIPENILEQLPDILKQVRQRQTSRILNMPIRGNVPTRDLLSIGLSDTQQEALLASFLAIKEEDLETFWEALKQNEAFGDEESISRAQFLLDVSNLTFYHLPLVQNLFERRNGRENTKAEDLISLELSDWQGVIESTGVPKDIPGKTKKERSAYAATIMRHVETTFPMARLKYRLKQEDLQPSADVLTILKRDPDFAFDKVYLDRYLTQPGRTDGIADIKAATNQLKSLQRLYYLTPRYTEVKALLNEGLDSAWAIAKYGKSKFLSSFSEVFGDEELTMDFYQKAEDQASASIMVLSKYSDLFNNQHLAAIPRPKHKALREEMPNWASLFGNFNLCNCEHCRSIYSPAAYMVDVLAFLNKTTKSKIVLRRADAHDILLKRRPDLAEIELTCVNTNTPLPYIDLVNEVLENAIAPLRFQLAHDTSWNETLNLGNHPLPEALNTAFSDRGYVLSETYELETEKANTHWVIRDGAWRFDLKAHPAVRGRETMLLIKPAPQTYGLAEELNVYPEHINQLAYKRLARQIYPFILPFDLWYEEVSLYLDHLKSPLYRLREVFGQADRKNQLLDETITRLYLKITSAQENIIIANQNEVHPWEFWGLIESNNTLMHPLLPEKEITGDWLEVLAHVPLFMKQTDLTFEQLEELLQLKVVQEGNSLSLVSSDSTDPNTCDVSKLRISNLTAANTDQIHRFLRLWLQLDWTMHELDRSIEVVGQGDLNSFTKLSHVQRVSKAIKVDILELLSWWGTIDTLAPVKGKKSLFEKLFLNRTLENPDAKEFEWLLHQSDSQAASSKTLTEVMPTLLAAFRIDQETFDMLQQKALNGNNTLNHPNLARLYRWVHAARKLKRSVNELIAARSLLNLDPFDPTLTEEAVLFVETLQSLRQSGLSIRLIDYLLRHQDNPGRPMAPNPIDVHHVYSQLRLELLNVEASHPQVEKINTDFIRTKLSFILPENLVNEAINMLAIPSSQLEADETIEVKTQFLTTHLGFFTDTPAAINELLSYDATWTDEQKLETPDKRLEFVWTHLRPHLIKTLSKNSITKFFAETTHLSPAHINLLIGQLLKAPGTNMTMMESSLSLADKGLNLTYYSDPNLNTEFGTPLLTTTTELAEKLLPTGLDPSSFSVRWESYLHSPKQDTYIFSLETPNTARVYINGKLALEKLSGQGNTPVISLPINLEGEAFHSLLIEFQRETGEPDFMLSLLAKSGNQAFKQLSSNQLFPHAMTSFSASYTLLHKASLAITALDLEEETLEYIAINSSEWADLDWNTLPLQPITDNLPFTWSAFERLWQLSLLNSKKSLRNRSWTNLFEQALQLPENEFRQLLAKETGWKVSDLAFLHTAWNLTYPTSYRQTTTYWSFLQAYEYIKKIGITAQDIESWLLPEITYNSALNIKKAVKAKYDNETWHSVAKPLNDEIRLMKRDALVSYLTQEPPVLSSTNTPDGFWVRDLQQKLLESSSSPTLNINGQFDANTVQALRQFQQRNKITAANEVNALTWAALDGRRNFENPNNLYMHYLTDVEMDPCMMTSRIKQANSSLQLFVQRSLMGLEPGVKLNDVDAEQWKWMKNYRVWEANRKVFLYPENWIEPELRDDKTPLFKNLESTLLQNELTDETAEDAFRSYLYSLDEIARLEIVGMVHDKKRLHLFGRTRGVPHHYFYRYRENSSWMPWEKIELDIQGEHFMPIVWNGRLLLFWAIFEKVTGGDIGKNSQSIMTENWEITLVQSEYTDAGWTSGKQSEIPVSSLTYVRQWELHTPNLYLPLKTEHFFRIIPTPNELYIFIYNAWHLSKIQGENKFSIHHTGQFTISNCTSSIDAFSHNSIEDGTVNISTEPYEIPLDGDLFSHPSETVNTNNGFIRNIGIKQDWQNVTLYNGVRLLNNNNQKYSYLEPIDTYGRPNFPFSYQVDNKAFIVDWSMINYSIFASNNQALAIKKSTFNYELHYHPTVCKLMECLNIEGLDGMLARSIQALPKRLDPNSNQDVSVGYSENLKQRTLGKEFENEFKPVAVSKPFPQEDLDFDFGNAYSQYNWELFFHIPLLIADRLSKNQKFEDAHRWFHYIFDPLARFSSEEKRLDLDKKPAQRFWQFLPFFLNNDSQESGLEMMALLHLDKLDGTLGNIPGLKKKQQALKKLLKAWKANPFRPHLIARHRISAYQKTVVMKYLDNLIAWADQLFRRDTIESINEATQLYVLASEILGERPPKMNPQKKNSIQTYAQLQNDLGAFSNAVVGSENVLGNFISSKLADDLASSLSGQIDTISQASHGFATSNNLSKYRAPSSQGLTSLSVSAAVGIKTTTTWVDYLKNRRNAFRRNTKGAQSQLLSLGQSLYFCLPKNDVLDGYWDMLADRLFKIRHCMNIEGVTRQLALFEPPIDPAILVKAVAAGIDISSALSDLYAPLPNYRFQVVVRKAIELCNELKSLGQNLLIVLEKRDAEGLAQLRANHEVKLLEVTKEIKEQQLKEAKANKQRLLETKVTTTIRKTFYEEHLNNPKLRVLDGENDQINSLDKMGKSQGDAADYESMAAYGFMAPNFSIPMGPGVGSATFGGSNIGALFNSFASEDRAKATTFQNSANRSSIMSGRARREEEWQLQVDLAESELRDIEKQLVSAEVRIVIAERDRDNHYLQTSQSREVATYLRSKYTNQELYGWMLGQISSVYFQTYQMTYDLAKQAEKSLQFELGLTNTNYIQFGYWDNLKKGLLAGDKLYYDLQRLDVAYLEKNKRNFEITKHISLSFVNPMAHLKLKEIGACEFEIPELLFDLDHPGQYFRRIKSVSITIPCIVGPYASVSAKLTLLKNRIRKNGNSQAEYAYSGIEDPNFMHNLVGMQSIATSSAQGDSGMFELNFRDERYLPFEGAGAISTWKLELPDEFRCFDYDTISDVILHMNYTARDGGDALKEKVNDHVETTLNKWTDELAEVGEGLLRLISMKQEFSTEWYRFFQPQETEDQILHKLGFEIKQQHFPYFLRDKELGLLEVQLALKFKDGVDNNLALNLPLQWLEGPGESDFIIDEATKLPTMSFSTTEDPLGSWHIQVPNSDVPEELKIESNDNKPIPLDQTKIEDMYLVLRYTV